MKRGPIIIGIGAVIGVLAQTEQAALAQRLQALRPPPVSLSVPHPIPPLSISPASPGDLYRQLTPLQPPIPIYGPGIVYGPTVYLLGSPSTNSMRSDAREPAATGDLRFDVLPGSAQIYIDGFYAGVIDDFGILGRALTLTAGPHRVELRAPGYATTMFAVNISANETTRYRVNLDRLAPQPALGIAEPARKTTTYIIPNCYAGDRPPTYTLPPGCSRSRMLVR